MKESNLCNYDETQVYGKDEGRICLKHVSMERGQEQDMKGRTIGLLVLFVLESGFFMLIWIFKA